MADEQEMVDRGMDRRAAREVLTGQVAMEQPRTLLICKNAQCRVEMFVPHAYGPMPSRCPACYGAGESR